MTIQFNPDQTTNSWKGIDLSSGLKSDSSIVYEPSEDVTSYEHGMSVDDSVVTINPNRSGTITINTLYGSDVDKKLAAAYQIQEESGSLITGTFITKNRNDAIRAVGVNAHIMSRPSVTYSASADNQGSTWVFKCERLQTLVANDTLNLAQEVRNILTAI